MSANEETHLLQQSPGGQQTTESSGADQDEFRWGQDPNVDIMVTEDLEADLRKGFARKTFGLTGAMLVVWAIIMFSSKFRMCSALGAAAQDPNSILSLHESNKNGKESLSKQTADDHKKYIMGYQNLCVTGFVQMKENGAGGEMTPDIPDDERLLNVHVALFLVAIQHLFIAGIVAFVGVCFAIPILCTIFCCGPCCGVGAVRKAPLSYILCFGLAASYGMIFQAVILLSDATDVVTALCHTATFVLLAYAMSFYCLDLTGMGLWIFLFGGMLPFLGLIFILMIMLPTSMACFGLCPATAAVVVPTMTKVVVNVVVFLCVSIYLVFYFQMIIGGKHRRNQFSIDDYALAASCLFLEIIELFLLMLRILAAAKRQ